VSRTILIILAIPVLLVIVAALLIPMLLDEEKLLAMAAETLEKETGAILVVAGAPAFRCFPVSHSSWVMPVSPSPVNRI